MLQDVRDAVEDWGRMRAEAESVVEQLRNDPPDLPRHEVEQGADLLRGWPTTTSPSSATGEYRLETDERGALLRAVPGTGLGILRADPDMTGESSRLPEIAARKAAEPTLLVLTKANSLATVHRPAYLDYVGVKTFDDQGRVVGERRFLGLLSSGAYTESITRIPLLRERAEQVLARVGFDRRSHAGKELMDTLENYPRDELFHTPLDELVPIAESMMHAGQRRQLRAFLRRDTYGRYVSALIYLPRDRYNTGVRERFATILREQLGGDHVEFTARVNESVTARVHFVVHPGPRRGDRGVRPGRDRAGAQRGLAVVDATTCGTELVAQFGEDEGSRLARKYAGAFPEAFKEDFSPSRAAQDVARLEAGWSPAGRSTWCWRADEDPMRRSQARLKIFRIGDPLSLSQVLPTISSLGVEVVDERPYQLEGLPEHDLHLRVRAARRAGHGARTRAELAVDTLRAIWAGLNETDGFNTLVLSAGLTWRQATVLRAYARYMRQGGTPFALSSIQAALRTNLDITRLLVRLFEARFDPPARRRSPRSRRSWPPRWTTWSAWTTTGSCAPTSPTSQATLRTNFFRPLDDDPERGPTSLPLAQARPLRASPTCRSRGRRSRSSSTRPGSRACTCGSARWPAVACAGRTVATTSAPRCSAWSRRRW